MTLSQDEKRWKRIQDKLLAESRGDEPSTFSSGRTLFGIKSTVEQQIDKVVAEENARCHHKLHEHAPSPSNGGEKRGQAGSPC